MAGFHGKDGSVYAVDGTTAHCIADTTNWTVNEIQETVESRVHKNDWVERVTGMRDWNATIEGQIAALTVGNTNLQRRIAQLTAGSALPSSTVYVRFRHSDSTVVVFEGPGIITDMSTSAPVGDLQTFSATIAGNGALTYQVKGIAVV